MTCCRECKLDSNDWLGKRREWSQPDLCLLCSKKRFFYIDIDGQQIRVALEKNWAMHMHHIEFFSHKVSDTGYRSEFFANEDMLEGETEEQFALRLALELNRKQKEEYAKVHKVKVVERTRHEKLQPVAVKVLKEWF